MIDSGATDGALFGGDALMQMFGAGNSSSAGSPRSPRSSRRGRCGPSRRVRPRLLPYPPPLPLLSVPPPLSPAPPAQVQHQPLPPRPNTSATGTCKNLTPQSLIPLEAPRLCDAGQDESEGRSGGVSREGEDVLLRTLFSLCMSMYCVSYVGARFAYDVRCRPALLRPLPIPLRIMQAYWRTLPYSAAPKATHSATFETDEEEELGTFLAFLICA
jgi:hypothetical protein